MAKRKKSRGPRQSPSIGGGGGMMQQIQNLQMRMESVQAELAEDSVTASAGGGVVQITMSGDQVCKGVQIDPTLLEDPDVEMLQDLLLTAINISLDRSRELQNEKMGPLTGGLTGMIPGLG